MSVAASLKSLQMEVSWREKSFILCGFTQLPTGHSAWDTAAGTSISKNWGESGHCGIVLNAHFLAASLSSAHKKIPQDVPSTAIRNSRMARMAHGAEKALQ